MHTFLNPNPIPTSPHNPHILSYFVTFFSEISWAVFALQISLASSAFARAVAVTATAIIATIGTTATAIGVAASELIELIEVIEVIEVDTRRRGQNEKNGWNLGKKCAEKWRGDFHFNNFHSRQYLRHLVVQTLLTR